MRFDSVGECIYCGKRDGELTDEHIIAYALGGTDVLPSASCKHCAEVTSMIELEVLRKQLLQVRAKLSLPSRKSSLPDNLPVTVTLGDEAKTFYLPKAEHPTVASFLLYPLPGVLGGNSPESGINVIAIQMHQIGGPSLRDVVLGLGSDTLTGSDEFHGNDFVRMLAKIALGYAVAQYGIDAVRSSPLRSTIIGVSDDAGRWIGCGRFNPIPSNNLYDVVLEKNGDWLFARIRLFAQAGTPEYIVVILEGDSKFRPVIFHGDTVHQNSTQCDKG
ncbi:MAG: HNH endonuclease [Candidatus Micrarchaeia archaeon]